MESQPIYQFYAELCDYKPVIWRRFQILDATTMARLGYIVMTMFEMQANHQFRFDVPILKNFRTCVGEHIHNDINRRVVDLFEKKPELARLHIELPGEGGFPEFKGRTLDAKETKVNTTLTQETESMTFSYDYGNGWEVRMVLERIFEDETIAVRELPHVLAGDGYGIIEDCGGPGGLENISKALKKKGSSQYRRYCDLLGVEDLDLSSFDLDDMNFRLKKVPRIYANAYEYGLEPTEQSMKLLTRKYKQ
ncbi:MAG: plasmid pRiA4b ORF-3 family protein [Actinobacteria bacterium]|nr:plasmid pRiA4b ORF-3 family protein [Actinomycetota bacterium]